jgi:hypothetical protein
VSNVHDLADYLDRALSSMGSSIEKAGGNPSSNRHRLAVRCAARTARLIARGKGDEARAEMVAGASILGETPGVGTKG